MSLFKNPSELTATPTLKVLVYGQPGAGKTTLALSAPKPVLFDFDGGINRVNKIHQCPTLQVSSWVQTQQAIEEIKKGAVDCDSIIIDTVGKMLDYMSEDIMSRNSKMKKSDGNLTQQGYMARKVMFKNFLRECMIMGKHVVFVAHEKEVDDGDTRVIRPDMSGSSLGDLLRDLDLVGYVQMLGDDRTVSWTPKEKFYAKNTCSLPPVMKIDITINDKAEIIADNDFLSRVFNSYNRFLQGQAKISEDYTALIDQIAADIASITDADGANAFIDKIDDYGHIWDSKAKARRLFAEHMAKVENVTYDKKTKRYAAKD